MDNGENYQWIAVSQTQYDIGMNIRAAGSLLKPHSSWGRRVAPGEERVVEKESNTRAELIRFASGFMRLSKKERTYFSMSRTD